MGIFDAKPVPPNKPESIIGFIPALIFMLPGAFAVSILVGSPGKGWAGVFSTIIAIYFITGVLTLVYKLKVGRWRNAFIVFYFIVLFVWFMGSRKI